MQATKPRESVLRKPMVQTLAASLVCILLGLLVGYIALLIISPKGATSAIIDVLKNFWTYSKPDKQLKHFGSTLITTAPLLMCALSVLFAYKVGLFNIGAAGQYVAGAGASLYFALALKMPWFVCLLAAILAGALLGAVSGFLKAYRNVNEVISCIMLNWISLYLVNTLLAGVKNPTGKDTFTVTSQNTKALLPAAGLDGLLNNKNVTIAIPLAILVCIFIWVLLNKTRLGYELRATGLNKNAAKYCGMRDRYNIILTMAIAGALAGLGAAMLYLSDFEQWAVTQASVPAMGFNGIAAAFLGGLNPIGAIFSSYFIQHITRGGTSLTSTGVYCSQTSDLITSVIIYMCGFVLFMKQFMIKRLDSRQQKNSQKGGRAA